MKNQPVDELSILSEQELEALLPIFTKDYNHEALAYIRNHHRMLHYWGEGVNILPKEDSTGKHRRFSFFDLVWLAIVKELRDYGLEKASIAVLKDELLSPIDHKSLVRLLHENQKQAEATLARSFGVSAEKVKALLEQYTRQQEQMRALGLTLLASYLNYIIGRKQRIRLLVSKEGHHYAALSQADCILLPIEEGPFNTSFVCIDLSEIMRFFAAQSFVTDSVKQTLLSPEEWKLIEETRQEGIKSMIVTFKEGKPQKLESTRRKKIALEARLTEVLLKGSYERLEIVTEKGQIVYAEQTIKKRFDTTE